MYELALSNSEVLAQDDDVVLDSTVGGMLREAAVDSANTLALVEHDEKSQIGKLRRYSLKETNQKQLRQLLTSTRKLSSIKVQRMSKYSRRNRFQFRDNPF